MRHSLFSHLSLSLPFVLPPPLPLPFASQDEDDHFQLELRSAEEGCQDRPLHAAPQVNHTCASERGRRSRAVAMRRRHQQPCRFGARMHMLGSSNDRLRRLKCESMNYVLQSLFFSAKCMLQLETSAKQRKRCAFFLCRAALASLSFADSPLLLSPRHVVCCL